MDNKYVKKYYQKEIMLHRVQKLLSNYGYCSREQAEKLIKQGRVKVNDKIISIGDKASEDDEIKVDSEVVSKQKKVYIIFNKPLDCVTALIDKKFKTVMDYININERVFPIGRLDHNTTGLLLLTNDGDFANKVMHPKYNVNKTYFVKLSSPIGDRQIRQIESGILLEDGKTSPSKVKRIDSKSVEITIHEGKKRIVRRMMRQLDLGILELKRISIGKLTLGNLKEGKHRKLKKEEMRLIFENGM